MRCLRQVHWQKDDRLPLHNTSDSTYRPSHRRTLWSRQPHSQSTETRPISKLWRQQLSSATITSVCRSSYAALPTESSPVEPTSKATAVLHHLPTSRKGDKPHRLLSGGGYIARARVVISPGACATSTSDEPRANLSTPPYLTSTLCRPTRPPSHDPTSSIHACTHTLLR